MAKYRGLYGQSEGWESRPVGDILHDKMEEINRLDASELDNYRLMIKRHDWVGVEQYTAKLRASGWGQRQIDRLLSISMYGLRITRK